MSTFEQAERRNAKIESASRVRQGVPEKFGVRDCNQCRHAGCDPDGPYCGHPHALKITGFGKSFAAMHELALCDRRRAQLFEQKHELYDGSEDDLPEAIVDRNGDVCLAQCKVCGLGEIQLDDQPSCPGPIKGSEEPDIERPLSRKMSFDPADTIRVAFAEIAVQELGFTEDGPHADTYGLSETGLSDGGDLMVAKVEELYITKAEHDRRVTELLRAVNRELGNRRRLLSALLGIAQPWDAIRVAEAISEIER